MAKKTQRARKRSPKAKPAAGEPTAHGLTGSAVADLFGDPLASVESCKRAARSLFMQISSRHGTEAAERIFATARPTDRRRKLIKEQIRTFYMIGKSQGWNLQETAKKLIDWNKEHKAGYDLQSEVAVKKAIRRLPEYVPTKKRRGKD
jgi:hypothetical protein